MQKRSVFIGLFLFTATACTAEWKLPPDYVLECEADSDCPDGTQRCDNGECVSKCEGVVCDDDVGEICDPTTGACVGGSESCTNDDDCSGGTFCEEEICVNDRLSQACSESSPCAAGLECVAGPVTMCVEPCTSNADCTTIEYCMTPDFVPIAPMAAFTNYCFPNLCAPGGDQFGVVQDTEYFAECSSKGTEGSTGICVGPIEGLDQGICTDIDGGQLPIGSSCDFDADQGSEDTCAGAFCAEPVLDGTCSELCTVLGEPTCQSGVLGTNTCLPSFSGGTGSGNGLCIPSLNPSDAGATCDPGENGVNAAGGPCVDGYGCGPADFANLESGEFACSQWCNPASAEGESDCAEGETCYSEGPFADLGLCGPTQ